jgi:hypothetical protein
MEGIYFVVAEIKANVLSSDSDDAIVGSFCFCSVDRHATWHPPCVIWSVWYAGATATLFSGRQQVLSLVERTSRLRRNDAQNKPWLVRMMFGQKSS